jgi:hypothetical protein
MRESSSHEAADDSFLGFFLLVVAVMAGSSMLSVDSWLSGSNGAGSLSLSLCIRTVNLVVGSESAVSGMSMSRYCVKQSSETLYFRGL